MTIPYSFPGSNDLISHWDCTQRVSTSFTVLLTLPEKDSKPSGTADSRGDFMRIILKGGRHQVHK